jgi:hypothetical protein
VGPAGEPVLSWTFSVGGRDWLCVRADDFTLDAPTYTCEMIPKQE